MLKSNEKKTATTTSGTYEKVKEALKHSESTLDRCIDEARKRVAEARARRNADDTQPIPSR